MNKGILALLLALLSWLALPMENAFAGQDGKVSHIVIVWLKEPGNQARRNDFVTASRQLNDLPGVISRHVGVVMPSDRGIVDDTFDVAITVTLENRQALKAYMEHPRHKKILEETIKPLVNRVVAYDIVSE